ncbi:Uncharacterised protein [Enterococcus durans]|uniref:Uncharacterized protein n=1 Tax=Enterococcus durans TaxID=53345 RepID=A0A377KKT8_9ENTE|nr:Uncharacterised protein [Enterococcus durans]
MMYRHLAKEVMIKSFSGWTKDQQKKRLGQKCLTPRNKPEFTKITFQIFVNSGLFPKDLLLLPPFIRF